MAARAATLADRRLVLLARSQRLRAELGGESAALATRFQLADRLVGIARSGLVRTLLVGGGALLLFGRPRQLFRTAGKLLVLWPIVKPFLPGLIRWWRGDERL